jgi:hypothetical protein
LRFARGFGGREFARKLRHFDSRQARLKSLVAPLQARTINGLLESVASEHAKDDWQPGIHLSELQSAGSFGADVIVVRRLATQDAADGD